MMLKGSSLLMRSKLIYILNYRKRYYHSWLKYSQNSIYCNDTFAFCIEFYFEFYYLRFRKGLVTEDLSQYSYEALVESYFDVDQYSERLKMQFTELKDLSNKKQLSEEEKENYLRLKMRYHKHPNFF